MGNFAIRVENLSKRYRIGIGGGGRFHYKALRDVITDTLTSPFRRLRRVDYKAADHKTTDQDPVVDGQLFRGRHEWIWALKDVSFEVKQGEVIGIIGRNGAGKSTLLKILSRITEPTRGQVEIRGRVGSLLEVGTGFHPELTGRENIYLSGAILGMGRAEIERKFDEIVAFAETESFLDTPVKHYSSGMYVRLAFAVAAHLDPEILVVDEVLAVGDAAFQRRCLDKMGEVVRQGRTVLFVSHNMSAVTSLCSHALLLREGELVDRGGTETVVGHYLEAPELQAGVPLRGRVDREGTGSVRFTGLRVLNDQKSPLDHTMSGQPCIFELSYESGGRDRLRNVFFQVAVSTRMGQALFVCLTRSSGGNFPEVPAAGRALCFVPELPLAPGGYLLTLTCKVNDIIADHLPNAHHLSVLGGDFFGTGRLPPSSSGPFLVHHTWRVEESAGEPDRQKDPVSASHAASSA